MRSFVIRSLIVVAVAAGSASPAQAFGWEWLEELSGPGPWIGVTYDQKLFCYFDTSASDRSTEPLPGMSGPCLESNLADGPRDWRRRLLAAGIGAQAHWSINNDLPYPTRPADSQKSLNMFTLNAFVDAKVFPRIHAGGAIGATRFSGKPVDDAFWKPTLEARVSAKLTSASVGRLRGSFDLRVGHRWFLGELTAADLGAQGAFREKDDGVWFASVIFDFN